MKWARGNLRVLLRTALCTMAELLEDYAAIVRNKTLFTLLDVCAPCLAVAGPPVLMEPLALKA